MMGAIWMKVLNITPDDFNKIALACVALIALLLTPWLQWRIARRQAADNIAAKRQVWIDELRSDAAEFLTVMVRADELRHPPRGLNDDDARKNFEELSSTNLRATELGIRIKLRLNPKEEEHNELVRLLKVMSEACVDQEENETEQRRAGLKLFGKAHDNVIAHLQKILKHEWERIKMGDLK